MIRTPFRVVSHIKCNSEIATGPGKEVTKIKFWRMFPKLDSHPKSDNSLRSEVNTVQEYEPMVKWIRRDLKN